jgi:hypothetical protein
MPAGPWKFENPFCNVVAQMAPLADGTGYGLALYAASGKSIDAHVTLIGKSDAYDAHVTALPLAGSAEDREGRAVLVRMPPGTKIEYFFVDSYALDGGEPTSCPSYVFAMGEGFSDSPARATAVSAQHLQPLGKLPCGHTYQPPSTRGDMGGVIGNYGNKPLTVELRAYIDSKGHALEVKTIASSGVDGIDKTAIGTVQQEEFHPAQFLCTPVVSEMLLQMEYSP